MSDESLQKQLDRVLSYQAIQQLPFRFAFAVDGRDLDTLVSLYVPDVKVGPPVHGAGREALRDWFKQVGSSWYRSMQLVGSHTIEFDDDDHAHGRVQCRVEQERGDRWVTMVFHYGDRYERRDGVWMFVHRRPFPLWTYDHTQVPMDGFASFPEGLPPRLPKEYPHWADFWKDVPAAQIAAVTNHPVS